MSIPETLTIMPTSSEEKPLRERRVTIEGKTLVVPGYVQEQMRDLDRLTEKLQMATEIGGFGFTRTQGDIIEVIDFIGPDQNKIFNLNGLMIFHEQRRLGDFVEQSHPLHLRVSEKHISITPEGMDDEGEWFNFMIDEEGKIDWGFLSNEVAMLIGTSPPETADACKEMIRLYNEKLNNPNDYLELKDDWDVVVSGGSLTTTPAFMRKVNEKAEELDAPVGFHMHHHPSLALMAVLYQDQPIEKREWAYKTLLNYSQADIEVLKTWGIDFFEIRAFGNVDNVCDPGAGVTSAYYRTSLIE